MLRKFLRPNLIKQATVIRGGGGYPRPDVPLLENYYNKRQLSIFELNVWWYDDVQPEYLVSFQDQHVHDHWNTFKVWGDLFPPLFAAMFAAGLYMYFTFSFPLGGIYHDYENSEYYESVTRVENERLGARRNFLNLDLTGEDGNIHAKCDGAQWLRDRVAQNVKKAKEKDLINIEGKNYVMRIENEVRSRFEHKQTHIHA